MYFSGLLATLVLQATAKSSMHTRVLCIASSVHNAHKIPARTQHAGESRHRDCHCPSLTRHNYPNLNKQ